MLTQETKEKMRATRNEWVLRHEDATLHVSNSKAWFPIVAAFANMLNELYPKLSFSFESYSPHKSGTLKVSSRRYESLSNKTLLSLGPGAWGSVTLVPPRSATLSSAGAHVSYFESSDALEAWLLAWYQSESTQVTLDAIAKSYDEEGDRLYGYGPRY